MAAKVKGGYEFDLALFICWLSHADEASLANMKMERGGWPEKLLILGKSGSQYVAMAKKTVKLVLWNTLSRILTTKNQTSLVQIG